MSDKCARRHAARQTHSGGLLGKVLRYGRDARAQPFAAASCAATVDQQSVHAVERLEAAAVRHNVAPVPVDHLGSALAGLCCKAKDLVQVADHLIERVMLIVVDGDGAWLRRPASHFRLVVSLGRRSAMLTKHAQNKPVGRRTS